MGVKLKMPKLARNFDEFLLSPNFSVVLNTEGMYFLLFDKKFREVVRRSDLIFCDGIGLKLALQVAGFKSASRLHGPDLFHNVIHNENAGRQLILGGTDKAHELLLEKYPNLSRRVREGKLMLFSAMIHEDGLEEVFELIEKFEPERVHVCLGIRRQEYIAIKIKEKYKNISVVGVGAAIDFESDNVKRSSAFFQNIGLEWLPRLLREPRMIPRQTRALMGFLIYIMLGVARRKKGEIALSSIIK